MPIPHNATASQAYSTYADVVPPYPFDFDFGLEPDQLAPPSYASLGYAEGRAGPERSAPFDAAQQWEQVIAAEEFGMPPDSDVFHCEPRSVFFIALQLLGFGTLLYASGSSYNPFGLQ